MKRSKIIKSILIPTLGISAIWTVVAISTSCSCSHGGTDIKVQSVTLDKTSTTLDVGGNETLTATVSPTDAANKNVTWTSNMPSVATVENGTITAVAGGTATITATSVDNPSAKATCAVTVIDHELLEQCATITANEDSTLTLNNKGETIQICNIQQMVQTGLHITQQLILTKVNVYF